MRKYLILNFILLGLGFGCSSNNSEPENFIIANLTTGTWKIDLYTHDASDINTPGINSTGDYLNYDLKFNSNGTLTATKGTEIITGNWTYNSGDFDTSTQLILSFNTTGVFKNLNKAWDLYGNDLEKISLRIGFKDFLILIK